MITVLFNNGDRSGCASNMGRQQFMDLIATHEIQKCLTLLGVSFREYSRQCNAELGYVTDLFLIYSLSCLCKPSPSCPSTHRVSHHP